MSEQFSFYWKSACEWVRVCVCLCMPNSELYISHRCVCMCWWLSKMRLYGSFGVPWFCEWITSSRALIKNEHFKYTSMRIDACYLPKTLQRNEDWIGRFWKEMKWKSFLFWYWLASNGIPWNSQRLIYRCIIQCGNSHWNARSTSKMYQYADEKFKAKTSDKTTVTPESFSSIFSFLYLLSSSVFFFGKNTDDTNVQNLNKPLCE